MPPPWRVFSASLAMVYRASSFTDSLQMCNNMKINNQYQSKCGMESNAKPNATDVPIRGRLPGRGAHVVEHADLRFLAGAGLRCGLNLIRFANVVPGRDAFQCNVQQQARHNITAHSCSHQLPRGESCTRATRSSHSPSISIIIITSGQHIPVGGREELMLLHAI